jgi:hypothetical protein
MAVAWVMPGKVDRIYIWRGVGLDARQGFRRKGTIAGD